MSRAICARCSSAASFAGLPPQFRCNGRESVGPRCVRIFVICWDASASLPCFSLKRHEVERTNPSILPGCHRSRSDFYFRSREHLSRRQAAYGVDHHPHELPPYREASPRHFVRRQSGFPQRRHGGTPFAASIGAKKYKFLRLI